MEARVLGANLNRRSFIILSRNLTDETEMQVYEEVGNRPEPPPTVAERKRFLDQGKHQTEIQGKTGLYNFGHQAVLCA